MLSIISADGDIRTVFGRKSVSVSDGSGGDAVVTPAFIPEIKETNPASRNIGASTWTDLCILTLEKGKIWIVTGFVAAAPSASSSNAFAMRMMVDDINYGYSSQYHTGTTARGGCISAVVDTRANTADVSVKMQAMSPVAYTVSNRKLQAVSIYSV